MNRMKPKVDGYLRRSKQWQAELQKLRRIILDCGLTEEVKWRVPCYTFRGRNVAFIGRLKESCVLSFVKGALLKDAKSILIQQTKNTQSVRIIRFTDVQQIVDMEPVLKAYLREAVEVEKAGLKVNFKNTSQFDLPEEFRTKLDELPALKTAFAELTPGRQRAYLLYFSGAKQPKTRASRVEKCLSQILD